MKEVLSNYGISIVDARYMQDNIATIYLLKQQGKIVIIETGTSRSLPYVAAALEEQNLSFKDVDYIIPTHIHLDHAGGAGALMKLCKNAKLVVHPRGARHMVDPSRLIQGTIAVYGEEQFNKLYGNIVPVAVDRIIDPSDNFILDFNNRELKFIHTPGHANHHFCIWDKLSKTMFTGDMLGVSYREFDRGTEVFIFPTTTPVQFNPDEMIKSIDKVMSYQPEYLCLTHFGAIKPNASVIKQLKSRIFKMVSIAKKYYVEEDNQAKIEHKIMQYLQQELKKMGVQDFNFCEQKLKNDVILNAQGLVCWQEKLSKTKGLIN